MVDRRQFITTVGASFVAAAAQNGIVSSSAVRADDDQKPSSRASQIHRDNVVVVIHDHNPIGPDVERMLTGGVSAKVFNILVDVEIGADFRVSADRREGWLNKGLEAIAQARKEIAADPNRLMLALKADHFLQAKRQGKVAILLAVEGAKLLEGRIENLEKFHELGMRELQLRWAVPNQIVERDTLTGFGIEVVRACQRMGIIVDLTHIPRRAFYEAIEFLEKPPIVSHGTGKGDLDDKALKALASRGGVLGIHFYSSYLGPKPTVARVVEQVDYISQFVGIDTAGLGVDFFPSTGKWFEFQRAQGTTGLAWAVPDIGQIHRVTDALLARNYSDADIAKVLGGNFLRVCRKVFGG